MQTTLTEQYRDSILGRDAEEILRRCVHCGFCNATCPTFQLLGDELDGPRGRIYQIKQILEGTPPTASTQQHLDRCLTCLACETTCPSGVKYSRLLEIGRELTDSSLQRSPAEKWKRILLRKVLLRPALFRLLLKTAHVFSFLLPQSQKQKIPPLGIANPGDSQAAGMTSENKQEAKSLGTLIMLRGCAQQVCAPEINQSAAALFSQLGFKLIESPLDNCCGALSHHNDATAEALELARKNIDSWWPLLEQGVQGIVVTASGCTTMVRDYGHLLADDEHYAEKAARVADLCRDPSELLAPISGRLQKKPGLADRICYQAPCSQQHGLRIRGSVEKILSDAGFSLLKQDNGHLCCGSAGSYSILQPALSKQLKENKLHDLGIANPAMIATANIGCLLQLQSASAIPVKHWLQLLEVAAHER